MCICHACDNPSCVNVDHLFLGTDWDNKHDSVNKRRHARGAENGKAKLTDADVKRIRVDPRSHEAIAENYGVADSAISNIKNDKTWLNSCKSCSASAGLLKFHILQK